MIIDYFPYLKMSGFNNQERVFVDLFFDVYAILKNEHKTLDSQAMMPSFHRHYYYFHIVFELWRVEIDKIHI